MVFILIVIMTREYSNPCVRERYWVCVCVGKFGLGIGKFGKSKNFFKGVGKAQRTINNIKDMPSGHDRRTRQLALTASLPWP